MASVTHPMPKLFSGLSIKLLITIIVVILALEVVIFLPSLANFRASWLDDRLRVGVVAARVLDAVPDVMALPRELTDRLLTSAEAQAIVYRREGQSQLIERADAKTPTNVVTADMRQHMMPALILGAGDTVFGGGNRTLRIIGPGDMSESLVELLMPERPLRQAVFAYSRDFFIVSFIIASITGVILYGFVSVLFIRPIQRLTDNMIFFRQEIGRAHV